MEAKMPKVSHAQDGSIARVARITGGVYLLYFIAGMPLILRSSLIVPSDAAATAAKITASQALYRATIVTDLVSYALYLGLAYLFYLLLRNVSRPWALLGTLFTVAGCIVLIVATAALTAPLALLSGNEFHAIGVPEQQELGLLALKLYTQAFVIGLFLFGIQWLIMGPLFVLSGFVPKAIGYLLTKQLLAFARAQPLEIKQLDLRDFFSEVTTLIRPSLRSNIELVTEISDQLWPVDADAGALELAILNLAFNARDAMKDGGMLRLSAHNEVLKGEPDGLKGEHVVLRVTDSGSGMPREVMDRVFEPFFTTKSFGEGTGLGLSQVFGFAKQIGGTIHVQSEVGKGSVFTLYIPASRGADAAQTRMNGATALGKVLIVEDDSFVAELAADMLGELGFESTIAHSAKEALDRLAGGEKPKLVFSDIIMPGGISGIELATKVRDRFPELPILLTTGYSEQVAGTHGFPVLQKPYELDALAGALSNVLKREILAQ
jgi:CheY-like chemotaxis protein/two-component sensor histidine kinase